MKKILYNYYKTKYNKELKIAEFNNEICLCDWSDRPNRAQIDNALKINTGADLVSDKNNQSKLINETINQLEDYFAKKIKYFDLPIALLIGTNFQKKVWGLLQQIPYGQTISYIELARRAGNEKASQAVGQANSANLLSIIIPCHRVIQNTGGIGGYVVPDIKEKLINLENNY